MKKIMDNIVFGLLAFTILGATVLIINGLVLTWKSGWTWGLFYTCFLTGLISVFYITRKK